MLFTLPSNSESTSYMLDHLDKSSRIKKEEEKGPEYFLKKQLFDLQVAIGEMNLDVGLDERHGPLRKSPFLPAPVSHIQSNHKKT